MYCPATLIDVDCGEEMASVSIEQEGVVTTLSAAKLSRTADARL